MNNNIKISQFNSAEELKTNAKLVIYQDGADLLLDQYLLSDKYVPNTRKINEKELSSDITITANDVNAYTKSESNILIGSKLEYYGNWNAAIPTYYVNTIYKYNGNLYTPTQQNQSSVNPFSDTTNWKALTSVISNLITTQEGLDEFTNEVQFFILNRINSNITLPSNVSGDEFIVFNYYSRTNETGGVRFSQKFTDQNGINWQRISYWDLPNYVWGEWISDVEIPAITTLSDLIGFHAKIKNNKFVTPENAVCYVFTGYDSGLISLFGDNQKLIINAKTVGSVPGQSALDVIYSYVDSNGITKSALYTAYPTENLTNFDVCPIFTSQSEIDNFKYTNAFAKIIVDGIPSLKPFFGDNYNKIVMRTYTIAGSGSSAGDWAQEATNYLGVEYIRFFDTISYSWGEWGVKQKQSESSVGGYANNLYFSEIPSDINGYETLSYSPDVSGGTENWVVNNSDGEKLFKNYIYPSYVSVNQIPAGVWSFTFYGKVSNNVGITQLGVTYFSRTTGGTETDLFTVWSGEINNTTNEFIKFEITNPLFNVNTTDRMGARIKAKTTHNQNITITYAVGDGYGAWLNNPNKIRHNQLRALNEDFAYQHVNTQQFKTLPLQTDGISIFDTSSNKIKLIEKRYLDEVYVGSSIPSENQVIRINTTDILNINYNNITGATISPDFNYEYNKFSSNYVAGNTVSISGYTNLPTYDCDKDIVILNNKNADVIFVPSLTSITIGGNTFNFKIFNSNTITVPTGKHLELSYGVRQLNSTTFNVLIIWLIES